jgi:hypothetical protein
VLRTGWSLTQISAFPVSSLQKEGGQAGNREKILFILSAKNI